jgi:hypothetical protein
MREKKKESETPPHLHNNIRFHMAISYDCGGGGGVIEREKKVIITNNNINK